MNPIFHRGDNHRNMSMINKMMKTQGEAKIIQEDFALKIALKFQL